MNVSGVSGISNYLIQQATAMKGEQVQQAIGTAVLKQTMDQQQAAGQALIEMIRSSGPANLTPGQVDIRI
jgi:hypothetical protein